VGVAQQPTTSAGPGNWERPERCFEVIYVSLKTGSTKGAVILVVDPVTIEMVSIPTGTFQMGSTMGESDEEPVHLVAVSAFQMGRYEVTQEQYRKVMGENPSRFKGDTQRPVEQVSWEDAVTFCNKLSELEGLEPCYELDTWECNFTKDGYRLPTEAEWEYACRAGTSTNYYAGDTESDLARAGWYDGNSGETTHPVGGKEANAFGLYDMHGNVFEWCNDWYGDYGSANAIDPQGPSSGSSRVERGGSWYDYYNYCRSAYRNDYPDVGDYYVGFRVVRRCFPREFQCS
jgi:formylglycine-generating enzyme required for sulfatase activity